MELLDWLIHGVFVAAALVCAWRFAPRHWPMWLRRLAVLAVALRAVTCLLRITVYYYYGNGDGLGYYRTGLIVSERLMSLHFPMYDSTSYWGTAFIVRLSGVVVTLTAGSMPAAFFVFAIFALIGVLHLGDALLRAFPGRDLRSTLQVLLLWPSIAFWPSGIGKDAVVLLAAGLLFHGVVVRRGFAQACQVAAGLGLALLIRPHIAVLLASAIVAAELLDPKRWTAARTLRTATLFVVVAVVAGAALQSFSLDVDDPQAIQSYVDARSGKTATGRSAIGQLSGAGALMMAPINIFFRPFVWEIRNPLVLVASLETLLFTGLILRALPRLRALVVRGRVSRFVRLAVCVTIALTMLYGMYYANLGILARQKIVVFVFALLLLGLAVSRPIAPQKKRKK